MFDKPVENMSSEELFELAKNRQAQEQEAQKEAARAQIDSLREQRRELVAKQRKELAAIDREIAKLTGRAPSKNSGGGTRGANISNTVLDILNGNGEMSTKAIKASLEDKGVVANNLAQTLAYLKRQGKVQSPARSVYCAA